jgi:hypothetical protein
MRLLDTYAVNCGAKIEKPFIFEHFFPLPSSKYITFQAESKYESKDYSFWQDVLDIIVPVLKTQGIEVVQCGLAKETGYQRIQDLRGKTTIHQLAYVIKNSMLHVGPDSLGVHIASSYDIPIVGLYSISYSSIVGPHFGTKSKQILFDAYTRVGNKKPSYAPQEPVKSINKIKPEEIANAIFKLLSINVVTPFETVHIGQRYGYKIVRELIPNNNLALQDNQNPIELRVDKFYDPQILANQLSYLQKAVVVTDKPIDLKLLRHFKSHIPMLVYKITENDSPKFVADALGLGIQMLLISTLEAPVVEKKRIHYYEYGKINILAKPNEETVESLRKDLNKLYYRTGKIIHSDGKVFGSHAALEAGIELQNDYEYNRVIDSPSFWEDLDFFAIVKKND